MGARPIYAKSAHNASLKFQKGVFFGVLVAKIAFFALSISSIYPIRIRFCGKTEKMCRLSHVSQRFSERIAKQQKSGQRKWKVDFFTSKTYAGVAQKKHLPWVLYI
ncbi:MAG: hypothetical protein IKZ07_02980, partial [Akkermansia sp.]|nr:hypothetical protein [Akkermansia sp.]